MKYKTRFKIIEIPDDWKILKLKDHIEKLYSGSRPEGGVSNIEKGIPSIGGEHINSNHQFNFSKIKFVPEEFYKLNKSKIILNDILIVKDGATTGRVAFVGKDFPYKDSMVNEHVFGLRTKINTDPMWLFHYLSSALGQNEFRVFYQGVAQGGINQDINEIEIISPPEFEQKITSPILSDINELIQKQKQAIEQTQKLMKGQMQKLLTRGIGHTKLKEVEWLFKQTIDIPDEWDWQKLLDNSILKGRIGWQGLTSSEYREEGKFRLVTGTDFKDGRINWETCVYVDKERYTQDINIQLKKHDVLITKDGTIGKIAYIDDVPLPATLNTGVFVVRPIDENYIPLFLYYILQSNYFIKFITRIKAGSTISHLYQKDFKFFHFPIPPIIEQQKISSILSNLDLLLQQENQYKEKLEKIKRGLMQQLLTGQTRAVKV